MKKRQARSVPKSSHGRNTTLLSLLVLVPVAIVSIVNFFVLYFLNLNSMQNDLRLRSEQTLEVLGTNLDSMAKIVTLRRVDTVFSAEAQEKVGTAYFPIIQQLREDSMWTTFFSGVRYYSLVSGLVYEMNRAQTADECFEAAAEKNGAYYPADALELQPWDRETLSDAGSHTRVMRVRNADGAADGVLFAVPLEYRSGEAPLSYFLFIVSDEMLENQIGALEGTECVLYYQDTPIFATEPEIREAIYAGETVEPQEQGPDDASFENGALRLEWRISSGLLMKRLVPTVALQGAVTFAVMAIALTLMMYVSRRNYQPIQNLLQKLPPRPETGGPIDEFKYIDFMLDDYAYSKRFFEESAQELRREKYLFYILDNQVEPGTALYEQCLHEGIRVDCRHFACVLMEDTEKNYELYDRLSSCRLGGDPPVESYSLYVMGNKYLFLLATNLSREEFSSRLKELGEPDDGLVRVSEPIEGVQNVRAAYSSVCWPGRREPYPVVELQLLQEAVETSNLDKAEFALRMIKSDLGSYDGETKAAVLREARELADRLPETQTPGDDDAVLDELLLRLASDGGGADPDADTDGKTQPRTLHTIMRFIEEHYADPNFSIKYMACVFGTSPSNLSHQFKKLTGQTLSRFIDELRISKAEELLAEGEKIHVVAQKLGYSTTPVFTETYKRVRGMTPSSYKSRSQQADK